MPIAYWLSDKAIAVLEANKSFDEMATTRAGMITGSNDIFVRQWHEVDYSKMKTDAESRDSAIASKAKWFPYSKGGNFRKWFGNNEAVVNWYNDGFEMRNRKDDKGDIPAHAFNLEYIFKINVCWNSLSTNRFSARLTEKGFLYDAGGSFASVPLKYLDYYLGFLNSSVAYYYLTAFNPTLNFQKGNVGCLPIAIKEDYLSEINELVNSCVSLAKADWNVFETSWDFKEHPFILVARDMEAMTIRKAFRDWKDLTDSNFRKQKENEEKLNRLFIEIYGLEEDLTPKVEEKDITIRKAVQQREVRSFISYAVGCMFGRYSLDVPGLVYAGGTWDPSKYSSFPADEDAILPICDDEYFEDDIVGLFINFVEKVYGKETLEENLQFIADALGGKGTSREIIRNYFINGFYADHVKVYQKRPIYWLFDSGKKNGFKCLIYLHRYKPDTIARIRTDYIHEQQSRYRTAIEDLNQRINGATASDKVKLGKKLTQVQEQAEELRIYEEKIHHLADQMIEIDLDDGVKVNYAKFEDVLAKIK